MMRSLAKKTLGKIVNDFNDAVKPFKKAVITAGLVALANFAPVKASMATFTYSPDQVGVVSSPILGLADTSSDYLLTNEFGWDTLAKDFVGNNQEVPQYGNTTPSKDAASFDDNHMMQLGEDNNLSKINLDTGMAVYSNGHTDIDLGLNVFGIGYDANLNKVGFGRFDGSIMSFHAYNFNTDTFENLGTLAFDSSQYGTPTGLDFVNANGTLKMLVGTRDRFSYETETFDNLILDINADTGIIDQYAKFDGSTNKLQDLLYDNGHLATSYDTGSAGRIIVDHDFTPIPEPATIVLMSLGTLRLLNYRAFNNDSEPVDEIQIKADGVNEIYCTDPNWQIAQFDETAGIDVDNDGVYDRGVYLTSDTKTLNAGESLEFEIGSAYSGNLQPGTALFFVQPGEVQAMPEDLESISFSGFPSPASNQPSDFNGDGQVDGMDLMYIADNWLTNDPRTDLNHDGIVDLEDCAIFAQSYRR